MKDLEKVVTTFKSTIPESSPFYEIVHKCDFYSLYELITIAGISSAFLPKLSGNIHSVSLLSRRRARDINNKVSDYRAREDIARKLPTCTKVAIEDMLLNGGYSKEIEFKLRKSLLFQKIKEVRFSKTFKEHNFSTEKYRRSVENTKNFFMPEDKNVKWVFAIVLDEVDREVKEAIDMYDRFKRGERRKTTNLAKKNKEALKDVG